MFISCGILVLIFTFPKTNEAFLNFYPVIPTEKLVGNPGEPLFLTPLIEQNKIEQAQLAAQTPSNGLIGQKSYSGYLTVDKTFNSNTFFWYFPARIDSANAPVVLWLQGGPGASSLIGLFGENGPFSVKSDGKLKLRKYSWTQNHNVIYIDNPVEQKEWEGKVKGEEEGKWGGKVKGQGEKGLYFSDGTGYSFTNGGYAQNETKIGEDLYSALVQFFTLFPELQKNRFFVAGESYAGKYVPAISYTIHEKNPAAQLKINLQGLAIGDGLSDPEHQLKYGEYLYQIGLIDANMKKTIQEYEKQAVKYIQNKQFDKALDIFANLFMNNENSLFKNVTGFENIYNYLYPISPLNIELGYFGKYIQRSDVRKTMHVGNLTFNDNENVKKYLKSDIMQSVVPWISELLSHYPVLIYSGQLDVIVAYPLTENYLQNLKFSGSDQYKTAQRYKWYVGTDLAGYVKQAGNLTEVLVRNAGHMVPTDQPQWAWDMISRFTRNKDYH